MVDIDFLGQLVESMSEAVSRLEIAYNKKNGKNFASSDEVKRKDNEQAKFFDEVNKLRTFIFDLHQQIDGVLKNV